MNDAIVILQARMASTRLPGKSLETIGARSLVAHALVRLRLASVGRVVLATTTRSEDDRLVAAAAPYGIPVFRGPSEDVLRRFALAAREMGARFVVRATADNPAVDIDGPRAVLGVLRSSRVDYVSQDGLPYGAAVEACSIEALERADALATDASDREHVTPLMRRDRAAFTSSVVSAPPLLRRPDIRLTVDTSEDLWFMRHLAARLQNWLGEPELADVIAAADLLAVETRVA